MNLDRLKKAMAKIDFLIGSAPVVPKTIERLKIYIGRIHPVRSGSTETCLQVLGIPHGSFFDRLFVSEALNQSR